MLGRGLQSLIPPSDLPKDNGIAEAEPVAQSQIRPQSQVPPQNQPQSDFSAPSPIQNQTPVPNYQPAEPEPKKEEEKIEEIKVEPARSSLPVRTVLHKAPESIFQIEVDKIRSNPEQPRRMFDPDGIRELASSIREFGLLQPIVVTKLDREVPSGTEVDYILISGERRLLASKLLGLERIPAIIRNVDLERERLELAIIENIQRENLNPIEVARSFARLQDEFRLTQREIAVRLGKSREVVANAVRLLDLPPAVQEAITKGEISESHGRLLLAITDPGAQDKLFRDLVAQRFTTRELKRRVDLIVRKNEAPVPSAAERADVSLSPELKVLQEKLSSDLGAPVAIQKNGETGKIVITFYSQEELQGIIKKLEEQ